MTVRMTHPRLGAREVHAKVVNKMRQNGWSVVEDDPPPKPKRRSKPDDKPPEKDSGGSSLPETEEES